MTLPPGLDLAVLSRRRFLYGGAGAAFSSLFGGLPASHAAPRGRFAIAIDPGHGGSDPGAVGVTGLREKDVTLDVALLLREALARSEADVIVTRERDEFVPLVDRVRFSQQNGAALFISLHADAVSDGAFRGASVYVLSPKAPDALTKELTVQENNPSDDPGMALSDYPPQVSVRLESLMFREKRALSARLQRIMIEEIGKRTLLLDKPGRQGNFLILRTGSIPSVLIQMGFMSNRVDERLLAQTAYRAHIAQAAAVSITRFLDEHEGMLRHDRAGSKSDVPPSFQDR